MVMMRLKHKTPWFLNVKPTGYVSSGNQSFLSLILIIAMINAFVRICSVLLNGISNQQAKMCIDFYSIITWSNHSFHHCGISTLQHLLLLSSHNPSNFSLTYGSRYSRMDQVKFMEDSLQKILLGPFLNILTHMSLGDTLAKCLYFCLFLN